jgi:YjbE family integral membrane protein
MLGRFAGVLLIDLILSGDNAVVIALAVRSLDESVRRRAILIGVAGAVGLRLIFVTIISFLISLPYLQIVGGLALLWVAWQLVQEEDDDKDVKAGSGLWNAVGIIMVADVVMSLDNVIALVGVSGGSVALVAIGIALTIPLVIFGASVLSYIMNRFPILIYLGAALLVYVAVELMFDDRSSIGEAISHATEGYHIVIAIAAAAVFTLIAWLVSRSRAKKEPATAEQE